MPVAGVRVISGFEEIVFLQLTERQNFSNVLEKFSGMLRRTHERPSSDGASVLFVPWRCVVHKRGAYSIKALQRIEKNLPLRGCRSATKARSFQFLIPKVKNWFKFVPKESLRGNLDPFRDVHEKRRGDPPCDFVAFPLQRGIFLTTVTPSLKGIIT